MECNGLWVETAQTLFGRRRVAGGGNKAPRLFYPGDSTVRRRDNQPADEAVVFTILTFTPSRLILCGVSDDAWLDQ